MSEPQAITRNPDSTVVDLQWAELGAAIEPSSGRKDTGEEAGDVYAAAEHNWLFRETQRWLRAFFSRTMQSSDALSGDWLVPTGAGIWSTNGVPAFDVFLSDDPFGVDSVAADVFLDPNGTGAVRMQVSVPKADSQTLPASSDTYVYVPIDVVSPPVATRPELAFLSVPVGDPAPVAPVGSVLVWRIETDGLGVVDQEILLFDVPVLKTIGIDNLSVNTAVVNTSLEVLGTTTLQGVTTINDVLTVNATSQFNDDIAANAELTVAGPATFISELNVLNSGVAIIDTTATINGALTCNGDVALGNTDTDDLVIAATTTCLAEAYFQDPVEFFSTALFQDTATFDGPVVSTNDVSLFGNVIANINLLASLIFGSNQLIGDLGSIVTTDRLVLLSNGTPSIISGEVHFDGFNLTIGDTSAGIARRIATPIDVYVPSAGPTGLAFLTVATISLILLKINEAVIIELKSELSHTAVGANINLRIQVNGGTIGGANPRYSPAAGVYVDANRSVRYVAPATAVYTFTAQIGANGGSTTGQNILFTFRRAN